MGGSDFEVACVGDWDANISATNIAYVAFLSRGFQPGTRNTPAEEFSTTNEY
jgi:hypothetical protein